MLDTHRYTLTRSETRQWHSPFSRILRESRQRKMVSDCERAAAKIGCNNYCIYDADELLVFEGSVCR